MSCSYWKIIFWVMLRELINFDPETALNRKNTHDNIFLCLKRKKIYFLPWTFYDLAKTPICSRWKNSPGNFKGQHFLQPSSSMHQALRIYCIYFTIAWGNKAKNICPSDFLILQLTCLRVSTNIVWVVRMILSSSGSIWHMLLPFTFSLQLWHT